MDLFRWTRILAIGGLLLVGPVGTPAADDMVAEAPIGSELVRLEKATRLMRLLRADEIYTNMAGSITDQLHKEVLKHTRPGNATQRDKVEAIVRQEVADAFDTLRGQFIMNFARIYARQFSERELTDLIAFYESDTGRKTLEQLPRTMRQGMALGQQVAALAMQMVAGRIADRLSAEISPEQAS